jgi:hypothetical protein
LGLVSDSFFSDSYFSSI